MSVVELIRSPGEDVVLGARGISLGFGGVQAVAGVSVDVRRGQLVGLIGPNGAGKSTLMTILSGGLKPEEGQVLFEGRDVTRLSPHRRARLGIIRTFQLAGELPRLTVMENLLLAAPSQRGESLLRAIAGRWSWRRQEEELIIRARSLLEHFDMSRHEDSYVSELSGGQRRLVEIMRGLMAVPRILLLDEPMAGVNPSLGRRIEGHLQALNEEGLTMVLVEHDLGTVERLCDRVIVMANGQVISEGSMGDMRAKQEVLDAYLAG